jgi:hypothetical protein
MKRALIAIAVLLSAPVFAQTIANGPYYATPSWDQTLPAAQRFIVLANFNSQAVLDRETGLVWQRAINPFFLPQFNASVNCNALRVDGRMGWRLPTIQELLSLVDASANSTALPAGHPFQGLSEANMALWTISRLWFQANAGWAVVLNAAGQNPAPSPPTYVNGVILPQNQGQVLNRYLCVRTGNNAADLQ